ncbi:MAG TPA: homoserine O-succinyltransferase [Clostridiales bacterium]|jgi:homoserine O-succinyltransferase|nr:homoserine O-succinyltransferase [Clostridiales bacterium]
MPVNITGKLPAVKALEKENIFVMTQERAISQDIRPLKVVILNLMPVKEITENQLLRLISNTPLQVDVVLLRTESYEGKHTPKAHLKQFYKTFSQIKDQRFDGLVITGAPVETMDFSNVLYWDELTEIIKWADTNVFSTLYICWAAQAGLYYHYGIPKHSLPHKISGIFEHTLCSKLNPIVRGFDDQFLAPHSRFTEVRREDIQKHPSLEILSESEEAGVYIIATKNLRHIYVTGHSEYDADTLHKEYIRDKEKGLNIDIPKHYYINDEVGKIPPMTWRSHSMLLFNNWLNYAVYQETPYDLSQLPQSEHKK